MVSNKIKLIYEASKKEALTFFVGAGISKISGIPNWNELIKSISGELGINKFDTGDYLTIPQMYYYQIKKDEKKYFKFIENNIDLTNAKPNRIHDLMHMLKPSSFITTNFDCLIEESAIQNCAFYKTVATDKEVPKINGDKFILKVHGDLRHKNIVLKEEDYLSYSENFKLIETLLKSIFSTNTVVFIGYGLNDYNIKLILNWAKTLLEDDFRPPFFLYTDNNELNELELVYHESRGLSIIDYREFYETHVDVKAVSYEERYSSILKRVISWEAIDCETMDKNELFEILFKKLEPLNKMVALKMSDISKKLDPFARIDEVGRIYLNQNKPNIFELFFEFCNQNNSVKIPDEYEFEFNIICDVLRKARVDHVLLGDKVEALNLGTIEFGDSKCISFDYKGMQKIINTKSNKNSLLYKKAFYHAKLKNYNIAYEMFKDVANSAFFEEDYLLYYLAQENKRNLYKAIKSTNNSFMYSGTFVVDENEKLRLDDLPDNEIFNDLPVEFKNRFSIFSDLYSASYLYRNAYQSFLENNKMMEAIEKDTFEMGITNADKVIHRLNENLHFFLGNGLYLDEFIEFKTTVKESVSLIVYKYSIQNKNKFRQSAFSDFKGKTVVLDEIDFYCLIEYFTHQEISDLMNKCRLKELKFLNIKNIEMAIKNLFKYYDDVLSIEKIRFKQLTYQNKLKTCITLLRYLDIPISTIQYIIKILLKHEFREILISDKILFLDIQVYLKEMTNNNIRKTILNKLIDYINQEKNSIRSGTHFELHSSRSDSNYWHLANYLSPKTPWISKDLSIVVNDLLNNYSTYDSKKIIAYYPYLYKKIKAKFIKRVEEDLKKTFDFDLFLFLIEHKSKVSKSEIEILKRQIDIAVEKEKTTNPNVIVITDSKPFGILENIGYLCFLNILNKEDFIEFLGLSEKFDFFMQEENFDFENFDMTWLFDFRRDTHKNLSTHTLVKEKIKSQIYTTLKEQEIQSKEKGILVNLLIEYYV
ncbi:SIR2 family protein [Acetobacterium sp.]|uniref:SIR2 family protein n=1 Tax=Acetobacterium sp. TaxID=1872094 RepID=UPI0035943962